MGAFRARTTWSKAVCEGDKLIAKLDPKRILEFIWNFLASY